MLRWFFRIVVGLAVLVVLYVGLTFAQVWWASRSNDTTKASAIIVMGAAQWNGVPSPVLAGRLDHAVALYEEGVAPLIVVTGGKQAGDAVTQGRSGYEYLRSKGLPDEAIKVEVEGTNSFEELSASALILSKAGVGSDVVIVTDPYHALRAGEIAEEVGLRAHVSPTHASSGLRQMARETVAVAIGRIIGYRRLASVA
jgi:uncharacterized SAM-binding protein YcdF (DUF218 family)